MSSFTYQTLIPEGAAADAALSAYAQLYGGLQRKLFAAIAAGRDPDRLKPEFCREHGLTARQFNAINLELKGKIAAAKECRHFQIEDLTGRIKNASKVVQKLSKPANPPGKRRRPGKEAEDPAVRKKPLSKLHQKKRRLHALEERLTRLRIDERDDIVRITFGSSKLFRAQFDLEANQYESHEQWRQDWRAARSRQFLVIGSKDETSGCQGCVATVREDGSLDLRLRLPDALVEAGESGKYLFLKGLRFAHGHENVLKALQASAWSAEEEATRQGGVALTWRFLKGEKHGEPVWYAHVTVDVTAPPLVTRIEAGAVGLLASIVSSQT